DHVIANGYARQEVRTLYQVVPDLDAAAEALGLV
ncbi:MAG: TIGR00730 family Rossman fold protein, partial [Rhodospirillaceae bacterium]|nr:TIGR00730 family Rossman fold protein [Rhodospirillaceae bacterium]